MTKCSNTEGKYLGLELKSVEIYFLSAMVVIILHVKPTVFIMAISVTSGKKVVCSHGYIIMCIGPHISLANRGF